MAREMQAKTTLGLLDTAFSHRGSPSQMSDSKQLSDVEYGEVMSFEGVRWEELTFEQVERNSDAVFWFSPEAFCYYLPGFLLVSLREGRLDANAYDSIIGMLDRSPEPDYWDDFFRPRWTLLTAEEVTAVAAWADWFRRIEPDAFHGNTFERVRATLGLLVECLESASA